MSTHEAPDSEARRDTFLASLQRDRSGNAMAIVAAAILPLMAIIGGGIDMGRGYLTESRLQAACDAGVLAARKKLGSDVVVSGVIPADVGTTGQSFFNINFPANVYGTQNRSFTATLETDYAISGVARADVPTTIMKIFAFDKLAVSVNCEAKLNFNNTDVMMVLDTTGSMRNKASNSDTSTKIDSLRQVVKNFHAQLEASKGAGTRIRYGFVPYSTNVNVGYLLKSGWMVDSWDYQGRVPFDTGTTRQEGQWDSTYTELNTAYSYVATYTDEDCPDSDDSWDVVSTTTDASGYTIDTINVTGTYYYCSRPGADDDRYTVNGTRYNNYRYQHRYKFLGYIDVPVFTWNYRPVTVDVRPLKGASAGDLYVGGSIDVPMNGSPDSPTALTGWFRGCIEERSTYQITDYSNVDFSRAKDLDIDLVPTPGDPSTQWRPILSEIAYARSLDWVGRGSFTPAAVTSGDDFFRPNDYGMSACPSPSRKLAEMNTADVAGYVDSLNAIGSTYHDIGMIWGGRLLSANGIFAADNVNVSGRSTSRHLIFLTDGETAPLDLSYGSYGVEPLDRRRWDGGNSPALTSVVENRFTVACDEVKKRNITVWVIGFGTAMTNMLKNCAGSGRWFQANNAAQLNAAFTSIATSMGDLRISK